jgi:hypothetical protein
VSPCRVAAPNPVLLENGSERTQPPDIVSLEETAAVDSQERKLESLATASHRVQVAGPWNLELLASFEHDGFPQLDHRNATALGSGAIYEDNTGQEDVDISYRYKLDLEKFLLGKQLRLRDVLHQLAAPAHTERLVETPYLIPAGTVLG